MVRPLKFESDAIQVMTDSELERLSYNLREQFATQLYSSSHPQGRLTVGFEPAMGPGTPSINYTDVGTAVDTRVFEQVAVVTGGSGTTYLPFPGVGTTTVDYDYYQRREVPSFPSDATLDSDGFVFYDSDGNGTLKIQTANTADHLYDEVLIHCLNQMGTGDKVGTYAIATADPSLLSGSTGAEDASGVPGTWSSMTTAFQDKSNDAAGDEYYGFGGTQVNYTSFLWLKRNVDTPPGSETSPLPLGLTSDGNLKERNIAYSDRIITNVLLPALRRRMIATEGGVGQSLIYELSSSVNSDPSLIQRGLFTDEARTTSTDFNLGGGFRDSTYYSYSTPTGAANTINTYRLYLRIDTN